MRSINEQCVRQLNGEVDESEMSMMRMAIQNILSKMKSLPCFTESMSAICRATRLE